MFFNRRASWYYINVTWISSHNYHHYNGEKNVAYLICHIMTFRWSLRHKWYFWVICTTSSQGTYWHYSDVAVKKLQHHIAAMWAVGDTFGSHMRVRGNAILCTSLDDIYSTFFLCEHLLSLFFSLYINFKQCYLKVFLCSSLFILIFNRVLRPLMFLLSNMYYYNNIFWLFFRFDNIWKKSSI